jgi:hypothetical protein
VQGKVIIAGPRDYHDYLTICKAIAFSKIQIKELVNGGANGVDAEAARWAKKHNIPVTYFRADWSRHGRVAGPLRNEQMADYAEALIAIVPYPSKGTSSMIKQAEKKGLKVYIYKV